MHKTLYLNTTSCISHYMVPSDSTVESKESWEDNHWYFLFHKNLCRSLLFMRSSTNALVQTHPISLFSNSTRAHLERKQSRTCIKSTFSIQPSTFKVFFKKTQIQRILFCIFTASHSFSSIHWVTWWPLWMGLMQGCLKNWGQRDNFHRSVAPITVQTDLGWGTSKIFLKQINTNWYWLSFAYGSSVSLSLIFTHRESRSVHRPVLSPNIVMHPRHLTQEA